MKKKKMLKEEIALWQIENKKCLLYTTIYRFGAVYFGYIRGKLHCYPDKRLKTKQKCTHSWTFIGDYGHCSGTTRFPCDLFPKKTLHVCLSFIITLIINPSLNQKGQDGNKCKAGRVFSEASIWNMLCVVLSSCTCSHARSTSVEDLSADQTPDTYQLIPSICDWWIQDWWIYTRRFWESCRSGLSEGLE